MAVDLDFRDTPHSLKQAILKGLDPGQVRRHFLGRGFRRRANADDADEVFGAGPAFVLLEAAVQQGPDGGAFADIKGADARGAVELVGRQAQEIDPNFWTSTGMMPVAATASV